ncbi:MAG TPA: dihydrolipoyl dehydrogenase [Candidatus Dormibacteraeota bacterium]|nr:dihydrolipoyl dehydrogenase [Candidatus Dormibacteraeota bacterium]
MTETSLKTYDLIVIGAGTGLEIASFASQSNLRVALVDSGPLGGTCLNRGCIPSKMLIHAADVIETIKSSNKFGIKSQVKSIDFDGLVKRVSDYVDHESKEIEDSISKSKNIDFYNTNAEFVKDKVLKVGVDHITAEKIFIVSGSRPVIPPIPGLNDIKYLTSKETLRIGHKPKKLVIVGGGYIAAELGHFYNAMGTAVTLIVRSNKLLENEDKEISEWFTNEFNNKVKIIFNSEVELLSSSGKSINVKLKGRKEKIITDQLLVATGMSPNTDTLKVELTGVKLDDRGYIKVTKEFKTNVEGIWAFGDVIGIMPFKHTANEQVGSVIRNAFYDMHETIDYHTIPHAVFSSPQVAGVGYTEQYLQENSIKYRVGKYELKNTAMGGALQENGLVKLLVDEKGKILGGHIVGPQASVLIQEIVIAMKIGDIKSISSAVHVHPALSEWVHRATFSLNEATHD